MAPPFGPFWHVGIFPGPREMTGGCGLERHREPVFHEFFEMEDGRCVHFSAGLRPQVSQCHIASRHRACITLANESGASEWSLRSKEMNVLQDFPSSRFASRIQFCFAPYATSPSVLLARQVNVQQCVSFLFVSSTSFLSPLKRFLFFNCVKRVRQIFLLHRGW